MQLSEAQEGQTWCEEVVISAEMFHAFIELSRDHALAHVDDQHARSMGYAGRIVHGFLVSLPYSRILGMFLPGSNTVIHKLEFDALAPVYVGEKLTYEVKVSRVIQSVKTVLLELKATNQAGQVVNRGRSTCTFRR